MTSPFEARQRVYVKRARDKETIFEVMTRRNTLLGQWAAKTMQIPAAEVAKYVQAVVDAGVAKTGKGEDPVLTRIRSDFAAKMMGCPDPVIQRKMKDLHHQAADRIVKKRPRRNHGDVQPDR